MSIGYSLCTSSYSWVQDLSRRELENLNYHLDHQDYFGTLATVLQLWHEGREGMLKGRELYQTLDELQYLQNNYSIKKK